MLLHLMTGSAISRIFSQFGKLAGKAIFFANVFSLFFINDRLLAPGIKI